MIRFCAILFIFLFPRISEAQQPDSLISNFSTGDSLITAIEREQDKLVVVSDILLIGNKTTRSHIITRELLFHKNDSLPRKVLQAAMLRSRENLINTSLFNFVDIYDQQDSNDSTRTHVIVRVSERWYIWPLPIFELVDRNFNEWWLTKDLARTNYGFYLTKDNFRGRKESLSVLIRLGYSQRLGLYYNVPYINRQQQNGISFGLSFTRNHEIAYGISDNKLLYYKDENDYVRNQFTAAARFNHRDGIHNYHSFGAEFQNSHINDTVVNFNNDYFLPGINRQKIIFLSYQYKRDYRNIKVYPLSGSYFDLEIIKQGLGILENEPDLLVVLSNYRKYWEFSKRWHFAAGVKAKISGMSFAPYYNSRGLGYSNDFVRGYEYYVVNGQNYFLLKSNIKFTLVPEKVIRIKYIPLEKFSTVPFAFYLNLFADMGYARDRQFAAGNPLANEYLFGSGIGLDYVTYYDLIFRVEYAVNKMGEQGLFLHFTAPIW